MRYTFKLIIAGDGGVGKTSLVDRYLSGTFHDNTRITLGVQFMVKRLTLDDDQIDLQIWDFGGEERFRFILPAYCLGAHGAIFMYDITNPASLIHTDDWMLILRSQNAKFPVLAVGTKADLAANKKVSVEEAMKTVEKYCISEVIEVSAKTGQNVERIFESITKAMMKTSQLKKTPPQIRNVASPPQLEKK